MIPLYSHIQTIFTIKTKNDHVDAKTLARMGLERMLELWIPISSQMRKLKKLCRERCMMLEEKTVISNRLHAESTSFEPEELIVQRLKQRIDFVKKQIKIVDKAIENLIDTDPILKEKADKIDKIKGSSRGSVVAILENKKRFI